MSNKAKIEIKRGKGAVHDRICISFDKKPDDKILNSLVKSHFTPANENDLKKWFVSSGTLTTTVYLKMFNLLLNSGMVKHGLSGLGAAYIPASFTCPLLDTITPDSMDYEIHIAVRKIREEIGGFHVYLQKKLKYTSEELCRSLSAEQIDAVVLAIYNIEKRGQGMIIGDQTGIGKGRVAAAMIRYGHHQGLKPIFLSEKPNLFSDIYRDLVDIGSEKLVPFIINSRESKTHVKDESGNVVYEALQKSEQEPILLSRRLPNKYDYILATYSQFNSPEKKYVKPQFFATMAEGNIVIMDEAHNASGSSNTGAFLQEVIRRTKGVTFLSATFAKRPDNMPIYAMKTAIQEANMDSEKLVDAIVSGGVALQEVLSSQLVAEGQMIRRERSFEGVEVNYITLDDKTQEHTAIADSITTVIRDVIKFQDDYITPKVNEDDDIVSGDYAEVEERRGTKSAGVDATPVFSKVFNMINQMLFSIKAESVAEKAIQRLKEGKKPIIAFANTMGSFLEQMENDKGEFVKNGDTIISDFKEVLMKALRGVMRYTVTTPDLTSEDPKSVQKEYKYYEVSELTPEGQAEYYRIADEIRSASIGISISPIDVIIARITDAGFTVGEVTGRKMEIKPIKGKKDRGLVMTRKKLNVNDAFRQYNNNELDCLMINQSGATGASAHAIVTSQVPADKVKRRVMIILQAELDINKEVQKRGRINRTGQISKPIYDYVNSAIPAEQRLMMMLQKKLKSLDANTTSNQKQSSKLLMANDFLNKYGDKIVTNYLFEDEELYKTLGDPLKFDTDNKPNAEGKVNIVEGAAHKVSGRVAILPTKEQTKFYKDVTDRYEKYIEYLKQTDQYDLEVEVLNLEASVTEESTAIAGKGGHSSFGEDSYLQKCMVNNLRKPFTKDELDKMIKQAIDGKDPERAKEDLRAKHKEFVLQHTYKKVDEIKADYEEKRKNIVNEAKYKKLKTDDERRNFRADRIEELTSSENLKIEKEKNVAQNRFDSLDRMFSFFTIGAGYNFPEASDQAGEQTIRCVFLGYNFDEKRSNPYAPSAVGLRFAVSNSIKYLVLAASGEQGEKVQAIIGLSFNISPYESQRIIDNWQDYTSGFTADKVVRYIVTGNVLQAFSDYKGKLVSYTIAGGGTAKGILMPDNWTPNKAKRSDMVVVPIGKAKKVIAGLTQGTSVYDLDRKLGIGRGWNGYIVSMPKNKNYKKIYTDKDVIALTTDTRDGFNMQSGIMKADVYENNMNKLIDILQDKYSLSVAVAKELYEQFVEKTEMTAPKTGVVLRAEASYEADKKTFAKKVKQQKLKKVVKPSNKTTDRKNRDGQAKEKRLRILKAKAKAKIKLLELIEL